MEPWSCSKYDGKSSRSKYGEKIDIKQMEEHLAYEKRNNHYLARKNESLLSANRQFVTSYESLKIQMKELLQERTLLYQKNFSLIFQQNQIKRNLTSYQEVLSKTSSKNKTLLLNLESIYDELVTNTKYLDDFIAAHHTDNDQTQFDAQYSMDTFYNEAPTEDKSIISESNPIWTRILPYGQVLSPIQEEPDDFEEEYSAKKRCLGRNIIKHDGNLFDISPENTVKNWKNIVNEKSSSNLIRDNSNIFTFQGAEDTLKASRNKEKNLTSGSAAPVETSFNCNQDVIKSSNLNNDEIQDGTFLIIAPDKNSENEEEINAGLFEKITDKCESSHFQKQLSMVQFEKNYNEKSSPKLRSFFSPTRRELDSQSKMEHNNMVNIENTIVKRNEDIKKEMIESNELTDRSNGLDAPKCSTRLTEHSPTKSNVDGIVCSGYEDVASSKPSGKGKNYKREKTIRKTDTPMKRHSIQNKLCRQRKFRKEKCFDISNGFSNEDCTDKHKNLDKNCKNNAGHQEELLLKKNNYKIQSVIEEKEKMCQNTSDDIETDKNNLILKARSKKKVSEVVPHANSIHTRSKGRINQPNPISVEKNTVTLSDEVKNERRRKRLTSKRQVKQTSDDLEYCFFSPQPVRSKQKGKVTNPAETISPKLNQVNYRKTRKCKQKSRNDSQKENKNPLSNNDLPISTPKSVIDLSRAVNLNEIPISPINKSTQLEDQDNFKENNGMDLKNDEGNLASDTYSIPETNKLVKDNNSQNKKSTTPNGKKLFNIKTICGQASKDDLITLNKILESFGKISVGKSKEIVNQVCENVVVNELPKEDSSISNADHLSTILSSIPPSLASVIRSFTDSEIQDSP